MNLRLGGMLCSIIITLTLVAACSDTQPSSPMRSDATVVSTKGNSGYIAVAADTFYMAFCLPMPCTYTGCKSCGKIKKPRLEDAMTELDNSIGGPSAVDAYFTSTTNLRDSIFPNISVSESALYAKLTSGNYWIVKQNETHNGQQMRAYYIGNHQTATPANATEAFLAD
jgi:hypothetical protein